MTNPKTLNYQTLVRYLYDRLGSYHDILCLDLPKEQKIEYTAKLTELQEILHMVTEHRKEL